MKSALSTLVKIFISGAILYLLRRNMDVKAVWQTFSSVEPLAVVFVDFLIVFNQSVSSYRWSVILKKDLDVSYLRLLSIYFVAMFFNNFLPTMVGGDIVKGYYLYKYSRKGDVAITSIFMDRYSGFAALMRITALTLIPGYALIKATPLPGFFALLIGSLIVMSLVIWVGPLHSGAMRLANKVHFYGINKKIDTVPQAVQVNGETQQVLLPVPSQVQQLIQETFYPAAALSLADYRARADEEAVPVRIYSNTTISGLAGQTREYLLGQGYTVDTANVSNMPSPDNTVTVIRDYGGGRNTALYLAALLGLPSSRIERGSDGLAASGVIIVVGSDMPSIISGGQ